MQVRNQTYLRMKNKEDIINLLREKSRSYSDIARVLRLSNTAISKIADDLISHNLIKREGDTKGRTGITLSINADFGYVLAVDFSGTAGRVINIAGLLLFAVATVLTIWSGISYVVKNRAVLRDTAH